MGLYDLVDVAPEISLPDYPPTAKRQFQTKTFPYPILTVYKITKEGQLLEEQWKYEEVPEEQRPCYPFKDDSEHIIGMYRKKIEGWKDTNYHGWINFYEVLDREWFEYDAKFTDGKLEEIRRKERDTENS